MSLLPRFVIAIVAFAGLQSAQAACTYPAEPAIPDGSKATKEEMLAANSAMKEYTAKAEEYMACLDQEEKPLPENATEEQRKEHDDAHRVLIERHNAAVDAENAVAARYNEQVRAFKKKQAG